MVSSTAQQLIREFEALFGRAPLLIVRCPGRVNLIGEHIDYSGYSVLPMAIEQSVYIAVAPNGTTTLRLRNLGGQYEDYDHPTTEPWTGTTQPKWQHYFLAGWTGGLQLLDADFPAPGLDVLVTGNVPPNAGLSSSSAIVCAALLATWAGSAKEPKSPDAIDRSGIAELAARVEHLIGVEGGGMDQASECLSQAGRALRIDFNPLMSTPVSLPPEACFAVVHSGASMNKGATSYYNERVVECRIAAQIIAKRTSHCNWREVRTLRDLAEYLAKEPDEMIGIVRTHFEEKSMTRDEIVRELETIDGDFVENSLNQVTSNKQVFLLRDRALHVYAEADRVYQFQAACEREDLVEMSRLMNGSFASCRDLYDCSCPELNETVAQCLDAGCLGARLTGAGWGGCVVALVDKSRLADIAPKLSVLFWSEPAAGIELSYCQKDSAA